MKSELFLLKYAKKHWHLLILGVILSVSLAFIEVIPPRLMKRAIDSFLSVTSIPESERFFGLAKIVALALGIHFLSFLLGYFGNFLNGCIGAKIVNEMRVDVFKKALSLPFKFFTQNPSGAITTRIVSDTSNVQEFFSSVVVGLARDVFLLAAVIYSLVSLSRDLFNHVYYLLPLIALTILLFRYFDRKAYRKVRANLAKLNAYLAEHISGISVIKVLNLEEHKKAEFSNLSDEYYKSLMEQLYVFGVFRPLIDFLFYLGVSLVVWYGARHISKGTVSLGTLFAFISYLDMFFNPIRDLSEKYDVMQNSIASAEKIVALMMEEGEKVGSVSGPKKVGRGTVRFEDVWFSYDGKEWVLKGVNLEFSPGKLYAIVGETGAGKSTLMSLVNGLYSPQRGRITIDGRNLLDYDLRSIRKQIAVVPQDVLLFSGTVLDNIRLFDERISEEAVVEVLSKIQALELIERLPGGLRCEIVERGSTLSAGERQIIALARAVLFDARIFVLDEATSNVDTLTEMRIQRILKELSKERTVLMIAHRLSTVKEADEIVVVHDGVVVEKGKHRELLEKRGFYYRLHRAQYEIG